MLKSRTYSMEHQISWKTLSSSYRNLLHTLKLQLLNKLRKMQQC